MEGGAYSSFGIATIYYAGSLLGGPYRLANMKYDGYRVYTNKPACGAQRGHGGVIARAAWEQQLDVIAEELGMDPVELRLKNMMEAGDVSCNGLKMNSLGMRECIEALRDGSGWTEKKGRLAKGKGIGMACGFFVSGAGTSPPCSEEATRAQLWERLPPTAVPPRWLRSAWTWRPAKSPSTDDAAGNRRERAVMEEREGLQIEKGE